jgi:SPP1 family predicted phage head-tail adaptor
LANLRHYIDPGLLDTRIAFETASGGLDPYGEEVENWYQFAEVWAKVDWVETNTAGKEVVDAGQVIQTQTVTFTIRYLAGITAKMRINMDGQLFDIQGIAGVGGRKRFQRLVGNLHDSNPI